MIFQRSSFFFAAFVLLLSCSEDNTSKLFVAEKCKVQTACQENCTGGDFKKCYIDKARLTRDSTVRDDCHALNVGRTCTPCENIFTLNFAGAIKDVSCEQFYEAIYRKNKLCDNCLEPIDIP